MIQRADAPPVEALLDESLRDRLRVLTEDENSGSSDDRASGGAVAHGLFQYPAMMVPSVQRAVAGAVLEVSPEIQRVLDPFVGTATSLAALMDKGVDCYGQDINPLATLVARTRLGPQCTDSLEERADRLIARIREDQNTRVEASFPNLSKWFTPEVAQELSRIRRGVRAEEDLWLRRLCWVAVAETVRLTSNDRTSTYKLHARPEGEIKSRFVSPLNIFSSVLSANTAEVKAFWKHLETSGQLRNHQYRGRVEIALADTTKGINVGGSDKFDLVLTSPPYGDNTSTVPYGQHSYLPLQWIDLEDIDPAVTKEYLRTTQEIDRRSVGGRTVKVKEIEGERKRLTRISPALQDVAKELVDKPHDRVARVLAYCRDLFPAVEQVVSVLTPNAYLIWTIGNRTVGGVRIPNDEILTDLLSRHGIARIGHVDRSIKSKRMPGRNDRAATMNSEQVIVFRRGREDHG